MYVGQCPKNSYMFRIRFLSRKHFIRGMVVIGGMRVLLYKKVATSTIFSHRLIGYLESKKSALIFSYIGLSRHLAVPLC